MKKKIVVSLLIIIIIFNIVMMPNKTYFKTSYIGTQNQNIYIPLFSYFKDECCFTAATFYSMVPKIILDYKIDNYLNNFKYIDNKSIKSNQIYGYYKNNKYLFQSYEVIDHILYREIVIVY